jgi:hypothetical protein
MKTLLKLAIAALVVHAGYQVGMAYWQHYQFQDAVQQVAQFAENEPTEAVKARVLDLAAERGLPIGDEDLTIERAQRRIEVNGAYVRDLTLAPGFSRPWDFTVHVVVLTLN